MSQNGKKVGVVAGIVAFLGGAFFLSRKKAPKEEEAMVTIEILDANGNPVPRNSPSALIEGTNYTVRISVTNTTTRGGIAVSADLAISVNLAIGGTTFISGLSDGLADYSFAAGESYAFTWPFYVPIGFFDANASGLVDARVISPDGVVLATGQDPLSLTILETVYGATIVIGI